MTRTPVKREKAGYKLESGRHRSSMMWYLRIYGIMICQHKDAWYMSQRDEWDKLKATLLLYEYCCIDI